MKRKSYQLDSSEPKYTKYLGSSDKSSSSRRSSSELVRERTNFILQKLNSLSKPTHEFTPSSSSGNKAKGIFTSLRSKIENLSLKITDSYLKETGSNISLSSHSEQKKSPSDTSVSEKESPQSYKEPPKSAKSSSISKKEETYESEEESVKDFKEESEEKSRDDSEEESDEEEHEVTIAEKTPMTATPKPRFKSSEIKTPTKPKAWTDQELIVLADYLKKAKSSVFVPENLEKIVKQLNAKFEEKGLNTRLNKKDLIQKLSEDIQKLKTKIHLKNKRYESAVSRTMLRISDPKSEPN